MHRLLEKDSSKILELIEHFYKNKPKNTYSYLAELINSDKRTLTKLLNELKYTISMNNWENIIELHFFEKELIVDIGSSFSINYFYSYYTTESLSFKLCEEIFYGTYTNADIFSEANYISKATLYRKITPLKEILSEFNLELDLSSESLILGNEHQIRFFFYLLFWETFYSAAPIFKDIETLRTNIQNDILSNFSFNHTTQLKLELLLAVTLTRVLNGFGFRTENKAFFIKNFLFPYEESKKTFCQFFSNYSFNVFFNSDYEFDYIHFILTTSDTYPMQHFSLINTQAIIFEQGETELANEWIHLFCTFFKIQLRPVDYFYLFTNLIYIQAKAKIFIGGRTSFRIQKKIDILKEEDYYSFTWAQEFYDFLIKSKTNFYINEQTNFKYTLVIKELIDNLKPPLKLLLLSMVSEQQQYFLQNKIIKLSPVPLTFVSSYNDKPSLVISDFPLDYSNISLNASQKFQWLPFPTNDEWNRLISLLQKKYNNFNDH